MSGFWGNYPGNENSRLCPMCRLHPDRQELLSECSIATDSTEDLKSVMNNIYSQSVTVENARKLVQLLDIREEYKK